MIFAAMNATDWAVIIGAIVLGLQQLYRMKIESDREAEKARVLAASERAQKQRDEDAAEAQRVRGEEAAKEAKEVKRLAAVAAVKSDKAAQVAVATSEKIDDVARTAEHGVVLANSAMLAEKEGRAESDERLARVTGKEEDRVRADASRRAYEKHKKEQEKLSEEIKAAAEKRAVAKVKSDKEGTEATLVNVQDNIEKIEGHTGRLADATIEAKEAVEVKDAEADKTKG